MIQGFIFKGFYNDCNDFWKAYFKTFLVILAIVAVILGITALPYVELSYYLCMLLGAAVLCSIEVLISSAITKATNPWLAGFVIFILGTILNNI